MVDLKRVSVREARARLADLIGQVYYGNEPVILEKRGRPVAVLVSPEQFERLRREEGEEPWSVIDRIQQRNRDVPEAEVERDVAREVEAVRQELYDKDQGTKSRPRH